MSKPPNTFLLMFCTFVMRYKRYLFIFPVRGRNPSREIYFNKSYCTLRFPVYTEVDLCVRGNDRLWPFVRQNLGGVCISCGSFRLYTSKRSLFPVFNTQSDTGLKQIEDEVQSCRVFFFKHGLRVNHSVDMFSKVIIAILPNTRYPPTPCLFQWTKNAHFANIKIIDRLIFREVRVQSLFHYTRKRTFLDPAKYLVAAKNAPLSLLSCRRLVLDRACLEELLFR